MVTRKSIFYLKQDGTIDPESWLNHVAMQRPESGLRLIRHAMALGQLTGKDRQLQLGMSCLQLNLTMADLLLDLVLDEETIAASLVYANIHYAELDLNTVQEQLGSNVTKLLRGVLHMEVIGSFPNLSTIKHNQLENFRKMLLAMADDMRVVLLKLAERTALMRARKEHTTRDLINRQYARETLIIYAPLANRLGINTLRCELEDLAMKKLAPRVYKSMTTLLQERLLDRATYVEELAAAIEVALSESGIQDFTVSGRVKHLYGIYRKMKRKKLPLHEIYDLNALRINVNSIDDCYQTLNIVQRLWTPVPGQFDDYIATPKENGYRSIHTAIYGSNQKITEIQIRTYDMHQESEHGVAAHWRYKDGAPQQPSYHAKIAWLRQVLAWQKELVKRGSYLTPSLMMTLDDRVYVFTPTNDILDFPKGATPLDFAYHIHSEVGHRCYNVKINGVTKPLTHTLSTGEQVEILTSNQPNPSWDWLNPNLGYLHTARAKAKVLHWFRQRDYHQHVLAGQLLLEKECKRLGLTHIDQEALALDLNFPSRKELFAVLGSGEIRIVQVLHALHRHHHRSLATQEATPQPPKISISHSSRIFPVMMIEGIEKIINQFARCCKPIPGDPVCGFVIQGKVTIHRSSCHNMIKLDSHRLIEAAWSQTLLNTYPVDIYIEAWSHVDLLQEITGLLKRYQVNLGALSIFNDSTKQCTRLQLTLEIKNLFSLYPVLTALQHLTHVITVRRR